MVVTAEQVADALSSLLPRGTAYLMARLGEMRKLLLGLSNEFVRVRERMAALIVESNPIQTTELLPEWEIEYGLPDTCISAEQTIDERRAAVLAKAISSGGQSIQFYLDQASALGKTATITEDHGAQCGIAQCGDQVGDADWNFVWLVTADGAASEALECVIEQLKPAHTYVHFKYEG